ncbi:MAG: hypothetical protein IPM56_04560 [Ignavibacteriales bacterium]|nr:MAG: hypothetical protein IPM56_04560 [Ignavibacteriales bacterium]
MLIEKIITWYKIKLPDDNQYHSLDPMLHRAFEKSFNCINQPEGMTLFRSSFSDGNCLNYYLKIPAYLYCEIGELKSKYYLHPVSMHSENDLVFIAGSIDEIELV